MFRPAKRRFDPIAMFYALFAIMLGLVGAVAALRGADPREALFALVTCCVFLVMAGLVEIAVRRVEGRRL